MDTAIMANTELSQFNHYHVMQDYPSWVSAVSYICGLRELQQRRLALEAAARLWPGYIDKLKQEITWEFQKRKHANRNRSSWYAPKFVEPI